ncbi:MAG: GNAT family N-acetyltransferase [Armatimonadetes bacterium]|nr:GNAT family N-acetyltransferase [Armatimonadota bacterium]
MTVDEAVEVFVRAFCHLKSRTSPYLLDRFDGLWILHDPPGRRNPRKTEVVTTVTEPEDTVSRIAASGTGWHFLCDVQGLEDGYGARRAKYKDLGYRAVSTERLFVHGLSDVPEFTSDPPPRVVTDEPVLASIPQSAPQKRKLQEGTRITCVWDDISDIGWASSVRVGENAWAADLYVHRPYRGQGFGRALMSRLLQDDRESGVRTSVLLATSDGARLYPHLGYREIGVLQMFCPVRRP